jgi:hypothetical protein
MKFSLLFLCVYLGSSFAFEVGENFTFKIRYGFISVGIAEMSVNKSSEPDEIEFRSTAKSADWYDGIYKVRDTISTFVNQESLLPRYFVKKLNEGSWHNHQIIDFNGQSVGSSAQLKNIVYNEPAPTKDIKRQSDTLVTLDGATHTITSAFYLFRNMDLKPGKTEKFLAVSGKKKYELEVITHGYEKVEVPAGNFDCIVIEPVMSEDGIFDAKGKMKIWLTNDDRRMPVQVKSSVAIGSISIELLKYKLNKSSKSLPVIKK